MENPKKVFYLLFIFLLTFIILLNFFMNSQQSKGREAELKYFKEFDLKLKGVVCNIEKQTDTYKFLIGLDVFESNYTYYPIKKTGSTVFCIKDKDYAVFADHNDYAIGDTILIGYSAEYFIKCLSDKELKFKKKREQMMLYNIASPTKRMKQLVDLGCQR